MKKIYIKPSLLVEDMEVEHLMTPSKMEVDVDKAAPDSDEEVIAPGGSTTPTDGPPEESKGGGGFFWFDLGSKWSD